jgi:hypothetical protein
MPASTVQVYANYSVRPLTNISREVVNHAQGYVLVSYKTPVAQYDRENDILYVSEKRWSPTTDRHIKDFGAAHRPGRQQVMPQEFFTGLLTAITGKPELA